MQKYLLTLFQPGFFRKYFLIIQLNEIFSLIFSLGVVSVPITVAGATYTEETQAQVTATRTVATVSTSTQTYTATSTIAADDYRGAGSAIDSGDDLGLDNIYIIEKNDQVVENTTISEEVYDVQSQVIEELTEVLNDTATVATQVPTTVDVVTTSIVTSTATRTK